MSTRTHVSQENDFWATAARKDDEQGSFVDKILPREILLRRRERGSRVRMRRMRLAAVRQVRVEAARSAADHLPRPSPTGTAPTRETVPTADVRAAKLRRRALRRVRAPSVFRLQPERARAGKEETPQARAAGLNIARSGRYRPQRLPGCYRHMHKGWVRG